MLARPSTSRKTGMMPPSELIVLLALKVVGGADPRTGALDAKYLRRLARDVAARARGCEAELRRAS
jgi:hypothetical protein